MPVLPPFGGDVYRLLRGHYSSVVVPTNSCPTHLALLSFDSRSRLRSPCKLLPAPAASGLFPTLALRIFPAMPEHLSRRFAERTYLFLPLQQRPSPLKHWVGIP